MRIIVSIAITILSALAINLACIISAVMSVAERYDNHTLTGTAIGWAIVGLLVRELLAVFGGILCGAITYGLWGLFSKRS